MSRATCLLAVALGLAFAIPAFADEKPTPAERLKAIRKEVADAETAFRAAWAKLPDPFQDSPEVDTLGRLHNEKQAAGFAAAWEIAKADPKSEAGFDALEWLVMTPRAHYLPIGKPALALMTEHHATNPRVGKAVAIVARYPAGDQNGPFPETVALFKAVSEKNPDRTCRGQAFLGLASLSMLDFVRAEFHRKPTEQALAAETERRYESIIKDYGNCPSGSGSLGEKAKAELLELRILRIGKTAPEIEGEDTDGVKFKLSDSRGKVTLLVFWAGWCGPCMGDVPHELELVEHFKGRPFVMIGVNGDDKTDDAKKAIGRAKIGWRSFWNGDKGPVGQVTAAWNVHSWPTTYVIDHTGTIRYKHLRLKLLDEPLEKLVAEAEKATGK